eukprot:TRINITY_DN32098_c0_g1_i1.p1 TRINITY_DN32098_c0_g1~~TRINITY_DN32098_c0_g1_i1.p1  ORF type:complete len:100 (+),score=1.40 TRINITY_DN32098_c0_g1_i1:60-359(+)
MCIRDRCKNTRKYLGRKCKPFSWETLGFFQNDLFCLLNALFDSSPQPSFQPNCMDFRIEGNSPLTQSSPHRLSSREQDFKCNQQNSLICSFFFARALFV